MTHWKDWGYEADPSDQWFAFIGYNPPPQKMNDSPWAVVADSPVPQWWWYYQPFMVESHAMTKFSQDFLLGGFSTWLESYLIVGPTNQCVGW